MKKLILTAAILIAITAALAVMAAPQAEAAYEDSPDTCNFFLNTPSKLPLTVNGGNILELRKTVQPLGKYMEERRGSLIIRTSTAGIIAGRGYETSHSGNYAALMYGIANYIDSHPDKLRELVVAVSLLVSSDRKETVVSTITDVSRISFGRLNNIIDYTSLLVNAYLDGGKSARYVEQEAAKDGRNIKLDPYTKDKYELLIALLEDDSVAVDRLLNAAVIKDVILSGKYVCGGDKPPVESELVKKPANAKAEKLEALKRENQQMQEDEELERLQAENAKLKAKKAKKK